MKKKSIRLIAVFLMLTLSMTLCPPSGTAEAAAAGDNKGSEAEKTEGKGYDTPEDAIKAYAQAFKDEDLDAMLSTFAIESFCSGYDLQGFIGRTRAYSNGYFSQYPFPAEEGSLGEQINIENRKNTILDQIDRQMLMLVSAENGIYEEPHPDSYLTDILEGGIADFSKKESKPEDIEQLITQLGKAPDFSKMEIREILYGEALEENVLSVMGMKNMYIQAKTAGAEGFKPLALHVSLGDYDAILIMDTVCYNGRWYNLNQMGFLGSMLNIPYYSGGIATVGPELASQWDTEGKTEIEKTMKELREYMLENMQDELEEYHEELESSGENITKYEEEFAKMSLEELVDFFALTELK